MEFYKMSKHHVMLYGVLSISLFAQACSLIPSNETHSSKTTIKSYAGIVTQAQLTEVANTVTKAQIKQVLLSENSQNFTDERPNKATTELQSAVLLKELNCIDSIIPVQPILLHQCEALTPLTLHHPSVPKEITSPLNLLLRNKVIQGYNVKQKNTFTSRILQSPKILDNNLLYGHSSLTHAKQLIALLKVQNVNFTWQLTNKTSAFNIRPGWEDMSDVEKVEMIRYAQEYDLLLTFENHENKLRFMPIINQYAKLKGKTNEKNNQQLIIDAWWQPFYRSFIDEKNYKQVTRINLVTEEYIASTLALNNDHTEVLIQIKKLLNQHKTAFTISTEHIWVNPSFYRYLTGKYK